MPNATIIVKAAYDAEAGVWYVAASSLPGLNLEAESIGALLRMIPGAASDLIECARGAF